MISERLWCPRRLWVAALPLVLGGCLLVGQTEYRVEVLPDGSARVTIRYIDLSSDGETDSAAAHDLDILLGSFASAGEGEHLPPGVRLVEKRLGLERDTLVAEVLLAAPDLASVEGFSLPRGRPTVIIPDGQRITWTNGAVSRHQEGGLRIQWSDTASRLVFDIQPINDTGGRPLARLYGERKAPER